MLLAFLYLIYKNTHKIFSIQYTFINKYKLCDNLVKYIRNKSVNTSDIKFINKNIYFFCEE